jgi:hypothetical protein
MVNVIKWGSYETWLTEDMLKSDGRFLTCANAPKGALTCTFMRWQSLAADGGLRTSCGLSAD